MSVRSILSICAAIAVAVLWAGTSRPAIYAGRSIDWLVLTSDRIAIVRVLPRSSSDSTKFPRKVHPSFNPLPDSAYVRYEVVQWLRGSGARRSEFADWRTTTNPPVAGERLLLLWSAESPPAEAGVDSWLTWFDLTHPDSTGETALTNDFRVFHDGDSILIAVRNRLDRVRRGQPFGDRRKWTAAEMAKGRGSITYWMPDESEAQYATWSGSANTLTIPADAERYEQVMSETKHLMPAVRGDAATMLREYPGPRTIARLREMLSDDETVMIRHGRGQLTDTTHVHIVRVKAYRSLVELGVDAPKPLSYESDSRLVFW